MIEDLEDKVFEIEPKLLNGISVNLVLKVTNGSVIEQAVRHTRKYSNEQWKNIVVEMESSIKKMKDEDISDITPRLYLSQDILEELEALHLKLCTNGNRIPS